MHVGNIPSCTTKLLNYFHTTVKTRWPNADYVFISGDLNMRVDSTSPTEAARRAEKNPARWYEQLPPFLDPVHLQHPGDAICAQYTFNNPGNTQTANDLRCDSLRFFERIDYTLITGDRASAANVVKAASDKGYFDANGNGDVDAPEQSAGHRGIRTVVRY
jgi:hypothetical protein